MNSGKTPARHARLGASFRNHVVLSGGRWKRNAALAAVFIVLLFSFTVVPQMMAASPDRSLIQEVKDSATDMSDLTGGLADAAETTDPLVGSENFDINLITEEQAIECAKHWLGLYYNEVDTNAFMISARSSFLEPQPEPHLDTWTVYFVGEEGITFWLPAYHGFPTDENSEYGYPDDYPYRIGEDGYPFEKLAEGGFDAEAYAAQSYYNPSSGVIKVDEQGRACRQLIFSGSTILEIIVDANSGKVLTFSSGEPFTSEIYLSSEEQAIECGKQILISDAVMLTGEEPDLSGVNCAAIFIDTREYYPLITPYWIVVFDGIERISIWGPRDGTILCVLVDANTGAPLSFWAPQGSFEEAVESATPWWYKSK